MAYLGPVLRVPQEAAIQMSVQAGFYPKAPTREGPTVRTPHVVSGLRCLLAVPCHVGLSNMTAHCIKASKGVSWQDGDHRLRSLTTEVTPSPSQRSVGQNLPRGQPALQGVGSRRQGYMGATLGPVCHRQD